MSDILNQLLQRLCRNKENKSHEGNGEIRKDLDHAVVSSNAVTSTLKHLFSKTVALRLDQYARPSFEESRNRLVWFINSGSHAIKNPWNAYPEFGPNAL